MTRRPSYQLTLRPERHVADPWRALKAALKALLRNHGLKCTAIRRAPLKREEPKP